MDRKRGFKLVRCALHGTLLIAFVALLIVWIAPADEMSVQYRWWMLAGLGLFAIGALVPPLRRVLARPARFTALMLDRLLLATIAVVVASEIELRFLASVVHSPLLTSPDAKAAERIAELRLRPGQPFHDAQANSLGFFDEEFRFERAANTRRIAVLGDSFAVGVVPYAENFITRLDTLLDVPMNGSSSCEVMNFGVFATSPRDYLHLYRTEVRRFAPDRVLVCIYVGNDFIYCRPANPLHPDSLYAVAFVRRFCAWAAEVGREARASSRTVAASTHAAPLEYYGTLFSPEAFLKLEGKCLEFCRREPVEEVARGYEYAMGVLTEMVNEIGPALRVVVIPTEFQVNDALYAQLTPTGAEPFDRELPQKKLTKFFAEHGVPMLDLLPVLLAAQRDGPTYQERDSHWNIHGNRVAADAIAAWLLQPQIW